MENEKSGKGEMETVQRMKRTKPEAKDDQQAATAGSSARNPHASDPWADLDEDGTGLSVDDFITTVMSRTANALRRTITLPYAERFGITVSEWRMLSVLAEARELSFSELVVQSVTDKAQVSRTLRLMQERGLIALEGAEGNPRWKQMQCHITPAGLAVYEEVMPLARKSQAAMIRNLSREERVVTYRALKTLRAMCEKCGPIDVLE